MSTSGPNVPRQYILLVTFAQIMAYHRYPQPQGQGLGILACGCVWNAGEGQNPITAEAMAFQNMNQVSFWLDRAVLKPSFKPPHQASRLTRSLGVGLLEVAGNKVPH